MVKEYSMLIGYADNVVSELHNLNEVADFIIKYGKHTDITITKPDGTFLLDTYGICINQITDMEYRAELIAVLAPKQMGMMTE